MKISSLALVSLVLAGCAAGSETVSQKDSQLGSSAEQTRLEQCRQQAAEQNIDSIVITSFAIDYPLAHPVANVAVCSQDRGNVNPPTCANTDSNGRVKMSVAPCQDVRLTFAHAGFVSTNLLNRVETVDTHVGARLLTTEQVGQLARAVGTTYDPNKSLSIITTWTPAHQPLADVSVAMTTASGVPFYLSASGLPLTSATATTAVGIMGVVNADVGTTEALATAPGKTCYSFPSVPGTAPNSAVIESLPGSISGALFNCE